MSRIDDIIAKIQAQGILSPARYEILFAGVNFNKICQEVGSSPTEMNELFRTSCENVIIPGTSIASKEIRVHGPIRELPYERLYTGDLNVTFRLDEAGLIRRFFLSWQDFIIKPETHDLEYYDEYICNMEIEQRKKNDDVSFRAKVQEVYPKQVNPLNLSFDSRDAYQRQEVSLAFRLFETEFVN